MTHSDLAAWRAQMGYSQRSAAEALGVGLKAYQQWERGLRFDNGEPSVIDRRTALACAAIAAGVGEWVATG